MIPDTHIRDPCITRRWLFLRDIRKHHFAQDIGIASVFGQATESNLRSAINALVQLHAIEALGHREFRLLWLGHSFTSMAFWMDQVARGWLIYELTDSALQLGLVRRTGHSYAPAIPIGRKYSRSLFTQDTDISCPGH